MREQVRLRKVTVPFFLAALLLSGCGLNRERLVEISSLSGFSSESSVSPENPTALEEHTSSCENGNSRAFRSSAPAENWKGETSVSKREASHDNSSRYAAVESISESAATTNKKRILEKKSELNKLESEHKTLKVSYDNEIRELKAEIAELEKERKETEQERTELLKMINDIVKHMGVGYSPILDELDEKMLEKEAKIGALDKTIEELSKKRAEKEAEWEAYITQYTTRTEQLKSEIFELSNS